tara:strand:- start:15031 stop:15357 length:327 start_codon:yes stop_codon:yes gene_type:complete
MAQNFRRYISNSVGASATTIVTADSNDTIIGISIANVASTQVNATVTITVGSDVISIVNSAPIPVGSSLQVLDGGAKLVMQSGDILKVTSSVASGLDVWVSAVDAIST